MKLLIAAVRDAKSESFARPLFVQTKGIAIRSFEDEVNRVDESNMLNKYPEDFQLYSLGYYDDTTGTITPEAPMLIVSALDVKRNVDWMKISKG